MGRLPRSLFYIPNLIDYLRVTCLFVGLWLSAKHVGTAALLFTLSAVADAIDGPLARRFNQATLLGATLDMITDRCFEAVLCMKIVQIHPETGPICFAAVFLDISSHWLRYCYALTQTASHKKTDSNAAFLLRYYYTCRPFMGLLCVAYDATLISSIVKYSDAQPWLYFLAHVVQSVCIPLAALKALISSIQAYDSLWRLALVPQSAKSLNTR